MKLRTKLLRAGLGLLALGVLAAGSVAYFALRNDAPPTVSLSAALQSIDGSSPGASSSSAEEDELAGSWTLVSGANSFVGYRVDETLGGIGATTAVGRTQSVEGSLVYDGDLITAVQVKADLRTLTSDKSMRDGQLRTQALETNTYPEAVFVLTTPIDINSVPAEGAAVTMAVSGQLTLHGVARPVELDVQGVIRGGQLVVVGSTEIEFADFNISQPRSAAVLSIEDHGTVEFQLVFAQA